MNDKAKHFFICYGLAIAAGIAMNPIAGFYFSVAVGALKEAYDYFSKSGVCDWRDFVADVMGALSGLATVSLL